MFIKSFFLEQRATKDMNRSNVISTIPLHMVKSRPLLGTLTREHILQYIGFLNGGFSVLGILILDSKSTCDVRDSMKRILGWSSEEIDDDDAYSLLLHYNCNNRK